LDNINIGIDWTGAISESHPCGENLEFDLQFAELESACIHTAEQQYGATVIAAQEPDWLQVLKLSTALSQRTRDLRVLLPLTRALTRLHGLPGLRLGVQAIWITLSSFWDSMHPQLVQDGEQDPQVRFSALSNLADDFGLVADLRQCTVITSELGALTVRDLERLQEQGEIELNGINISASVFASVIDKFQRGEDAAQVQLPGLIEQDLLAIQKICGDQLSAELALDLGALLRPLRKVVKALLGPQADDAVDDHSTGESDPANANSNAPLAAFSHKAIHSRKELIHQLSAACRYLEAHEPSNPAQMLIRRAIKVMDLDFMDVLRELAPEGLTQASFVTGVTVADNERH